MSSKFYIGDSLEVLRTLPDCSVQCVVTSPPYWGLRDYGIAGQLGLESTPDEYLGKMTEVFREVRRVLRDDGTLWLNMGDSYAPSGDKSQPHRNSNSGFSGGNGKRDQPHALAGGGINRSNGTTYGLKPKDLVGMPWRLAFALQADGWYLRSDCIWHKPNPMPESVRDRPTKAHEYIFLMTKSSRYFWNSEGAKEKSKYGRLSWDSQQFKCGDLTRHHGGSGTVGKFSDPSSGRNSRTVWTIPSKPVKESHFATFPPALVERCVKAGTSIGDVVLDPFSGAGTVALVCERLGRDSIGIELNPKYVAIAERRLERNRRRTVNGHHKEVIDLPGQSQFSWASDAK